MVVRLTRKYPAGIVRSFEFNNCSARFIVQSPV
jgi:hypothetical protein